MINRSMFTLIEPSLVEFVTVYEGQVIVEYYIDLHNGHALGMHLLPKVLWTPESCLYCGGPIGEYVYTTVDHEPLYGYRCTYSEEHEAVGCEACQTHFSNKV